MDNDIIVVWLVSPALCTVYSVRCVHMRVGRIITLPYQSFL